MSSMDFKPPDVTAARLRDAVKGAACDWALYFEPPPRFGTPLTFEEREANFTAVLDTLIQYHRQAGAVEALEAVQPYIDAALRLQQAVGQWPMADLEDQGLFVAWDRACFLHGERAAKALAAAQARLAAYSEEKP